MGLTNVVGCPGVLMIMPPLAVGLPNDVPTPGVFATKPPFDVRGGLGARRRHNGEEQSEAKYQAHV